jgi:hypothetical protein
MRHSIVRLACLSVPAIVLSVLSGCTDPEAQRERDLAFIEYYDRTHGQEGRFRSELSVQRLLREHGRKGQTEEEIRQGAKEVVEEWHRQTGSWK